MLVMVLTWEPAGVASMGVTVREDGRCTTTLVSVVEEVGAQGDQRAIPQHLEIVGAKTG
jgi:hypothetical protein